MTDIYSTEINEQFASLLKKIKDWIHRIQMELPKLDDPLYQNHKNFDVRYNVSNELQKIFNENDDKFCQTFKSFLTNLYNLFLTRSVKDRTELMEKDFLNSRSWNAKTSFQGSIPEVVEKKLSYAKKSLKYLDKVKEHLDQIDGYYVSS